MKEPSGIRSNKTDKDDSYYEDGDKAGYVGKYSTPEGLNEQYIEVEVGQKPLVILYLLHALKFKQVLCFTNTVEATHRLYLLVQQFGGIQVQEFSSNLHAIKRARILKQFTSGKIQLLICSDAMARGMDVEGVKCVISYDYPRFVKTYIHRVGRTARAGKSGTAFTLLHRKEIFHFKKMLREAGKEGIQKMKKIQPESLNALVDPYKEALGRVPQILQTEKKRWRPK